MIELYNEYDVETMKRIKNGAVDLLLQDTPFGVTQNEWDVAPDLDKMWPEWIRIGKQNAAFIFFATQPFASQLVVSNLGLYKYDIIWEKTQPTGFLNAKKMPMRYFEYILVFYKKQPTYNPQFFNKPKQNIRPTHSGKQFANNGNYGDFKHGNFREIPTDKSYPSNILTFENEQQRIHPTQKPIDLIRYLVKTYSNEGDLVFDGYSGSGTTAAACIMEERNFIGSELNKEYFELANNRIKNLLAAPTLFNQGTKVA